MKKNIKKKIITIYSWSDKLVELKKIKNIKKNCIFIYGQYRSVAKFISISR